VYYRYLWCTPPCLSICPLLFLARGYTTQQVGSVRHWKSKQPSRLASDLCRSGATAASRVSPRWWRRRHLQSLAPASEDITTLPTIPPIYATKDMSHPAVRRTAETRVRHVRTQRTRPDAHAVVCTTARRPSAVCWQMGRPCLPGVGRARARHAWTEGWMAAGFLRRRWVGRWVGPCLGPCLSREDGRWADERSVSHVCILSQGVEPEAGR
jgi:hypothetical protein